MVEEIYTAQKEREHAMIERLKLANKERDEAILRAHAFAKDARLVFNAIDIGKECKLSRNIFFYKFGKTFILWFIYIKCNIIYKTFILWFILSAIFIMVLF